MEIWSFDTGKINCKMIKVRKYIFSLVLFVLAIIPVLSLFHPGFPVTHDGQDHVARIANFYLNLTQGNLIPRWAPNLNWGYGHPILEFLYPLPSYIASIFHFLGLSFVDSTKVVYGLGMVLSLYFMYLWLSQFLSKQSSLFGAVLFTYAPYRFVDLYVRGDVGENLAFAFVPLVLFFAYKTYKTKDIKYPVLGAISLAFLILAHNAIALMFVPFILLYCLILLYISKFNKRLIFNLFSLIVLGFTLSAFFWLPALLEGKYTLRNIVTAGGYVGRFVSFQSLIYGPWSYGQTGTFTVQYGPLQWISILISPLTIYFFRKDKQKLLISLLLLFFTAVSTFLMLEQSSFIWSKVMLLQNFQFPWRFLAVIVFTTAVLGAFLFESVEKRLNKNILLGLLILLVLVISSFYSQPKGYQNKPESFYSGIYNSTTDTGESSPIWSVRFMEHRPSAPAQIVEGGGSIKETVHKATYRKFDYNSQEESRVLLNILYFPGWTVYVDGKEVSTIFQDPMYRGLMTIRVAGGQHTIEVVFKDTRLRQISELISAVSLLIILGFMGFRFVKK